MISRIITAWDDKTATARITNPAMHTTAAHILMQYGEHHYYAVLGGRELVVAAEPLGEKTRLLVQPAVEYDIYQLAAEALARQRSSNAHLSALHQHHASHAAHVQQPHAWQLQQSDTRASVCSSQTATMPIMHSQGCKATIATAATATAAAATAAAAAAAAHERPVARPAAAAVPPAARTQAPTKQHVSQSMSPKALCSELKRLRAAVSALEDRTATTKKSSKIKRPASSPVCTAKKRTRTPKVKPPWVSILPEGDAEVEPAPAANPARLSGPHSAPRISTASLDTTVHCPRAPMSDPQRVQPPLSWQWQQQQLARASVDGAAATYNSSCTHPTPWLHGLHADAPVLFPPLDPAAQREREEQAAMPRPGTAASCAMCASVSSRPASPATAPGMAREVLLLSGRNSPVRQALAACLEDARRSFNTNQQVDQQSHSHMDLVSLQHSKLRATLQALQFAGQEVEQQLRSLSIGPLSGWCPVTCSPSQHIADKARPQRTSSTQGGQEALDTAQHKAASNAGRLFWKP